MEATLNNNNTALEQFNFQLRQLEDTFQWIHQEHQAAAIASIESLVNELKHLSSCQLDDSENQEIHAQLVETSEKASLIPLTFGETAETLTDLTRNVLDSETDQSMTLLSVSDQEIASSASQQLVESNGHLTTPCDQTNRTDENMFNGTNENSLISALCSELTTLSSAQTGFLVESGGVTISPKDKLVRNKRTRNSRGNNDDGLASKKLKDISNVHKSSQRVVKSKRSTTKRIRNIAATESSDVKEKGCDEPEAMTSQTDSFAFELSCRQCRGLYKDYHVFKVHTCKGDQERKVFFCKHCDIHFKQPVKFQQHVTLHERNDCRICHTPFINRKLLSTHTKVEHGGIMQPDRYYHCSSCARKFIKRSSLYTHLKEHAESKIVCVKCGHFCEDDADYKEHLTKHTEEANFRCEKCDESFLRKQQYDQHMEGHEKYVCDLCEKSDFSTKKQLAKHKRVSHGIMTKEEKKHECQICHKKFQRPTLLKIHLRVHTGEKPVKCSHSDCNKHFRTYKSMLKHTATHAMAAAEKGAKQNDKSNNKDNKSFLCSHCAAKFHRKQGLLRHIQQLHCEDRPFRCPFCEYSCKCKTNLKRHVELHKDERRFVCELCGASFHAHATLKEHNAYVHSEVRGFVCGKCGKGFKGRSGLRRHIRSHSDDRPFVCDCGQSYKRKSHLKRHMISVHKIRFESKRVQRVVSNSDQSGASNNYDDTPFATAQEVDSSGMLVYNTTMDNCLNFADLGSEIKLELSASESLTSGPQQVITHFATAQEVDDSGMLVYNTTTDNSSSFADLGSAIKLELAASQSLGSRPQEVITHLQLPSPTSHILQQTLQQQSHIPITIQPPPVQSSITHLTGPLTSINDTNDLQHTTFDLTAGMPIAIPQGNLTLSIPAGSSTSLVSLPQQPLYHTVQTLTPVTTYTMDAKQPINTGTAEFCVFE